MVGFVLDVFNSNDDYDDANKLEYHFSHYSLFMTNIVVNFYVYL